MLSLLGAIYGKLIAERNRAYDRGMFRSHDLGARTISIGNLTVGGTGKTPLVLAVARHLIDRGETVCVLTRGYKRKSSGQLLVSDGWQIVSDAASAGDEAFEIASMLGGRAIVIANADRVAAARWAMDRYAVTRFVLDDGFQHRRAERDLDIVCIDALAPGGVGTSRLSDGRILPSGRLRESADGLMRAGAIVITRSDLATDCDELVREIAAVANEKPIFLSRTEITSLIDHTTGECAEIDLDTPVFAFCGLGNPEAFFASLTLAGIDVVGKHAFADHHDYRTDDIADLADAARNAGAAALITTSKDAVKIGAVTEMPILVAVAEIVIDEEFFAMI